MVDQKNRRLSPDDWQRVADWIVSEALRRKEKRRDKERMWKEIDRQLDMIPRAREQENVHGAADWYPQFETPLQARTHEVIAAETRTLLFPKGDEWFGVFSELDDTYVERWNDRRLDGKDIVPGQTIQIGDDTANALVHGTLTHFHRLYDFRDNIDAFMQECIKYGTSCLLIRDVKLSSFAQEARGMSNKDVVGPAVIHCPVKSILLDDTFHATRRVGIVTTPIIMRMVKQRTDDIRMAAMRAGKNAGWFVDRVRSLDKREDGEEVEIIEAEGDIFVATSNRVLTFENSTITVVKSRGRKFVARFKVNEEAFRSYVVGHFFKNTTESPYGTSPLITGQPTADAAAEALNAMMANAALSTEPPLAWDRNDGQLAAQGGPRIHPRATFPVEQPNAVIPIDVGNVADMANVFFQLVNQYEQGTSVNEPRLGERARSHTSATASTIEDQRGSQRTFHFIDGLADGPLETMLYQEYRIIKKVMKQQSILMNRRGIVGWVNIAKEDLPDNVGFRVFGSEGVQRRQAQSQDFIQASNQLIQLFQLSQAIGQPLPISLEEIAREMLIRLGIQDVTRFIADAEGTPVAAGPEPGVQNPAGGVPPEAPQGIPPDAAAGA